jgi:hypothetical protein
MLSGWEVMIYYADSTQAQLHTSERRGKSVLVLISFLLLVDTQMLQTNWSVSLVWISSSQHLPPEGEITPLTEGTVSLNHQMDFLK